MSEEVKQVVEEVKIAKYGTKDDVFYGRAERTKGKLTKDDLMVNAKGKVISKKSHENGKRLLERLKSANSANNQSGEVKAEQPKKPKAPKKVEVKVEEAVNQSAPVEPPAPKPKRTQRKPKAQPVAPVEPVEVKAQ